MDLFSGVAGSMSIDTLQIPVRRGFSQLEGVTSEPRSATYFWSPVSRCHNRRFITSSLCSQLRLLTYYKSLMSAGSGNRSVSKIFF